MKCVLLAAGLGTRLRPITDERPKCLVKVAGRPLLAWWFTLFEREEVTDVVINLHHHAEQVRDFVSRYSGPVNIELFDEPTLLGSGGTLAALSDFYRNEEQFGILYGDNLTDVSIRRLAEHHRRYGSLLTVATFEPEDPQSCGIFEVAPGPAGMVVSFEEKPQSPRSDRASAGIFIASGQIAEAIAEIEPPNAEPFDFGRHIMPKITARMNVLSHDGYIRDIGTHASLRRADAEFPVSSSLYTDYNGPIAC